jgi:3-phenylpropionate/cinnamic acid dioxygenase small subunit
VVNVAVDVMVDVMVNVVEASDMGADGAAVERAEDRAEIGDLIARLAIIGDSGDLAGYDDAYAEDAIWEHQSGTRHGRQLIVDAARARRESGLGGPGSGTRHVVTNLTVTFPAPDTAEAGCYVLFYVDTAASPTLRSIVEYHDTLHRGPDGWRITHRRITTG